VRDGPRPLPTGLRPLLPPPAALHTHAPRPRPPPAAVIEFEPRADGSTTATLLKLNQSPEPPLKAEAVEPGSRPSRASLVLLRHASTEGNERGLVMGQLPSACSATGEAQIERNRGMLEGRGIAAALHCPTPQCAGTARGVVGGSGAAVASADSLRGRALGCWEGQGWAQVSQASMDGEALPEDMESMVEFWPRVEEAWEDLRCAAGEGGGGGGMGGKHASVITGLVAKALGLAPADAQKFRVDTGSVTLVEFPDGIDAAPVVRCVNYTAHLGEHWEVPVYGDDVDGVCGIDGCF